MDKSEISPTTPEQTAQSQGESGPSVSREERRAAFSQAVRDAKDIGDIADAFERYAKK